MSPAPSKAGSFIAAVSIGDAAIGRLFAPRPIDAVGIGLVASVVASVIDLAMARAVMRGGRRPWSSFRPPRKNQRPNSSIQQVRDAEPFRRTQRMNWVRLSGNDGQVHDGATTGP